DPDELHLAGLLADIGQLILFLHAPEQYRDIYSHKDKDLITAERLAFDTDHIQLGIDFCLEWNFPAYIKEIITNHYHLGSTDGHSKITFVANQVTELLFSEEDNERERIFKELENNTKKILRLSLSEIEDTLENLPGIMEAHIGDFPEVQKDLNDMIKAGSAMIISLMKKKMDMVLLTQELQDSQKKLSKEKIFLAHMLNLSYFFSSLISPDKIISSLFEYFEKYIADFSINFIYKTPITGHFILMAVSDPKNGKEINIKSFDFLMQSKISNETIHLEPAETEKLLDISNNHCLAFPISFHHNFFGFLILTADIDKYPAFDLEMPYIQILVNIIANSFQNYHSFKNLRKEIDKKEHVTRELFRYDRQLDHSKKILIELQKSEIVGEMLPVIFHKLKNKLTPILGYSQILGTKLEDEKLRRRVGKIESNANDLTEQLNLLRDYFLTLPQEKDRENLNNIVNHLVPYFKKIEEEDGIKVQLELDYDLPEDMLISGQIELLLTNLVSNGVHALKAKGGGGTITIKTSFNDDNYTLSVHDTGIGMNEEDIPMVWVPFFSQFPDSAGLGMTICEKIAGNHECQRLITSRESEYTEVLLTFKYTPLPR
ncbi:MAG: HDOD domain-containing protein, partial [bacterium]|nr:HDOD domain-containing protein [bacterium]